MQPLRNTAIPNSPQSYSTNPNTISPLSLLPIHHSAFSIPHSTFSIQHSTFSIPHSTFSIPHSAFSIQHSSFSIQHSTLAISLSLLLRESRDSSRPPRGRNNLSIPVKKPYSRTLSAYPHYQQKQSQQLFGSCTLPSQACLQPCLAHL